MRQLKIIIFALTLISIEVYPSPLITVDTSVKFQVFQNWEATCSILQFNDASFSKVRDSVIKSAYEDLNVTRLRLEVRSGVENPTDHYAMFIKNGYPGGTDTNYLKWRYNRYVTVNDNADTTINWAGFHFTDLDQKIDSIVLPFKKIVESGGDKLFINLCYVAFTGQINDGIKAGYLPPGNYYIHDNPDEYAELVLAVYLHMRDKYGFVPDSWEILLEPDNVSQWDGTKMGKAIVATAKRLLDYGFTPNFVAPSCTNMGNSSTYFDKMLSVPGAIDYLKELSYHRYGGVSPANLKKITDRAKQYGIGTSMLEWWFNNSTSKVLYDDLINGNNTCWQGEVLGGFFNIDKTVPTNPKISLKPHVKLNYQYMHYIKPGAQRLEASSDQAIAQPALFRNPDGQYVFIVRLDTTSSVRIKGLPKGVYSASLSGLANFNYNLPNYINDSDDLLVPEEVIGSVITFVKISDISSVADNTQASFKFENNILKIDYSGDSETEIYDLLGRLQLKSKEKIIDLGHYKGFVFYRINFDNTFIRNGKLLID